MGYAMVVWLFWGAELHGKWLVACGAPIVSVVAACIWLRWKRGAKYTQSGEREGQICCHSVLVNFVQVVSWVISLATRKVAIIDMAIAVKV